MRYRELTTILCMLLWALPAAAQEIVSFNVPTSMCMGDSARVSFGFQSTRNIVIQQSQSTLGHSDVTFLPDGRSCGDEGCSYQSPVTFTDFASGATITSVNDIKYLRLNMEHSFLGDLYINVTCPNGQKADILRFSNYSGNASLSSCLSNIPASSRGWNTPTSSNHMRAYLGLQNTASDNAYSPCNHNSTVNAPGTGWNYCWSNNTNSNYSYAGDGGYVYRYNNQTFVSNTNGREMRRVDSSNVANGTNFYHPDQSFANLVGCPLNGTWYIEVIDGVTEDNGYIFEWELALDPNLLPPDECTATAYSVSGPGITILNDSTFLIAAPDSLSHDTTIAYTYTIFSPCGNIDSTVNLTFHPSYHLEQTVEACESLLWQGTTYTSNANLIESATTAAACDSITDLHLLVHPGYHLVQSRTIFENNLPYTFLGHTFTTDVADTLLPGTTTFGCDSNVTFTLTVYRNAHTDIDTAVCANTLPFRWNGLTLNASTDTTIILPTHQGADSIIFLHLTVLPASDSLFLTEVSENQLPVNILGRDYYTPLDTTIRYTNTFGCDSLVTHRLVIHHNHHYSYSRTICDNQLPYSWDGTLFAQADSIVLHFLDQYGADSTVTLLLTVNPTYTTLVDTTVCDNHPYALGNQLLDTSGTYAATLPSSQGCDSTVHLNLLVLRHNQLTIFDTICANTTYTFGDNSYNQSGTYTNTYTNTLGCDSIVTLHLGILGGNLHADILASPLLVTPVNPLFHLHDNSSYSVSRLWIIEDDQYTSRSLSYSFPLDQDTLLVQLLAFSPEGCTDTARAVIRIDRSALFTPNAFTPSQATNNTWQPALNDIQHLEIWIYSRTGLLVAHLQGTDLHWDGTATDGTPCPQGAYVYNLQYRTNPRPDKLQTLTGTILLIR